MQDACGQPEQTSGFTAMDNALIVRPIHFPAVMVMNVLWLSHHKRWARQNNPQRMLDSLGYIAYNKRHRVW